MVSLAFVFWMFFVLAGIIGAMRGWAKELLVIFSGVLALFIIHVLETYIGFVQAVLEARGNSAEFWTRTIIIFLLAFFGYQTPNIKRFEAAARREKVRDAFLGFFLGGANAWITIGSIWWYLDNFGYIYTKFFQAPTPDTQIGQAALDLLRFMPPNWLTSPGIYFAVAIAFAFVVIVYV
jgi:hypothetical protein